MNIAQVAQQFDALGNPTWLQVYRTLMRAGRNGLSVNRVRESLGIAASALPLPPVAKAGCRA